MVWIKCGLLLCLAYFGMVMVIGKYGICVARYMVWLVLHSMCMFMNCLLLVIVMSTPCRDCGDRPLGTGYMWIMGYRLWVHCVETVWTDHRVHIVDYGYTEWRLCEQATRYILWIMGTPCEGCEDRPLGTYRMILWKGTLCGDCTDRSLGTPRFIGMI